MPFGISAHPTSLETSARSTMGAPNRLSRKGDRAIFGAHCAPEKNRPAASGSQRAVPRPRAASLRVPILRQERQNLVWGAQPVHEERSDGGLAAEAICPGRTAA